MSFLLAKSKVFISFIIELVEFFFKFKIFKISFILTIGFFLKNGFDFILKFDFFKFII